MGQIAKEKKPNKLKHFFSELISKIDKKMEEKSKSTGCCSGPSEGKNKSCCS